MPSGVALGYPRAVATASDFGLAFGVSGSAELALPLGFVVVGVGYFSHPAEKFQRLFLCSPFCHIVSARLISDVQAESFD